PTPPSKFLPYTTLFRSVVGAAGVECRAVERLDLVATAGFECDVKRDDRAFLRDPEVRVLPVVETGGLSVFHIVRVAERLQGANRSEEHTSELQSRENLV